MAAMNKQTKELISLLQKVNEDERRVAYIAIGFAYSQKEEVTSEANRKSNNYKIKLTNLVGSINELAIVNYDELKRLIGSMVEYKFFSMSDLSMTVLSAKTHSDVFGYSRFLSEGDLDSIDKNIKLFKDTVSAFNKWYTQYDED